MKKLLLCFVLTIAFSPAYGNRRPLADEGVDVFYQNSRGNEGSLRKLKRQWQRACRRLALALNVRSGLGEAGIFSRHKCYFQSDPTDWNKTRNPWTIEVSETSREVIITLFYLAQGQASSESGSIASISFPSSPRTLKLLANSQIAKLVGYTLLAQAPARFLIATPKKPAQPNDLFQQTVISPFGLPGLGKRMSVMQIAVDERAQKLTPMVVGTAERVGKCGRYKKASAFSCRFRLPKEVASARGVILWGQIESNESEVQKLKDLVYDLFAKEGRDTANAKGRGNFQEDLGGFFGVRFGLPLARDGLYVAKAYMFGLLLEAREGIFDGLRLYYDQIPTVFDKFQEKDMKFSSTRLVLGWSFGLDVDAWKLRFDVTPKIGQWSFYADVPIQIKGSEEFLIRPFALHSAMSAGADIGVEREFHFGATRLWVAYDGASEIIKVGDGSIASLRAGADLIVNGLPISDLYDLDFLAFLLRENVTINRRMDEEESAAEAAIQASEVKTVRYTYMAAGVGASVSW